MNINEKIQKAQAYVKEREGNQDAKDLLTDAANIFADTYEEYMAIWHSLMTKEG